MDATLLLVLRHGPAEDFLLGGSDRDRPLKPSSWPLLEGLGRGLTNLGFVPGLILASPYLRAKQSAEALSRGFRLLVPTEHAEWLTPESSPEEAEACFRERLAAIPFGTRLLAVTHQPLISLLSARMCRIAPGFSPAEGFALAFDGTRIRCLGWVRPEPPFLDPA